MTGLEPLSIVLRALGYAGAIGVAGGALFSLSFPKAAAAIAPTLRRQIAIGFLVLLLIEPVRYAVFQLAIADGDPDLAFGPDLRAMGFETPIGQAALVRLAAAAVVVVAALVRARLVAAVAAAAVIGSFLIEGHTAASDDRLLLAPLLALHLAGVHWWLGALIPLIAVTRLPDPGEAAAAIEDFGRQALWIVAVLVAAGAVLALLLTGAELDLDIAYQQRLLIKLGLVAALIAVAAVNKLRLTPLLRTDFAAGAHKLRASIRIEITVAAAILLATAWFTATAPDA